MDEAGFRRRILVVEDDRPLARVLELELRHEGYEVELAADGWQGLEMAQRGGWGLLLLDLMLPGLDGLEVCRRVRKFSPLPIIVITARDRTGDKVIGLDAGADDYLTKPFAVDELLARVRALLRRAGRTPDGEAASGRLTGDAALLALDDLVLNPATREVHRGGSPIDLTKKEFDLLEFLLRNANIVLTRETILEKVWGFEYPGETNIVDVYIRYLRAKVDEPFGRRLIQTKRGVGYVLRPE